MIRVGLAGVGFMGWIHYLAYQKTQGVQLAAVASRDPKKRGGDWRGIQGNFGPPGREIDLSGVQTYETLDQMLADPDLDMIDLCLPPNLHADAAVAALQAGKHVFCEKPIALTVEECQRMTQAAEQSGKQLLVGHVLPFFPDFAHALKCIQSGEYGKLLGGTFKRVISDPTWLKDFYDPQGAGGPLVDLHVHDAHLIRYLFGMPNRVSCSGRKRDDVVEYCHTLFHFDDPSIVVSAVSGVINQQGRGFTHGFEIHLEKATMHFELAAFADEKVEIMPLKILTDDGKVIRPELQCEDPDIDPFKAEIEEAARAVRENQPSPLLSGELAQDALILCQWQTDAIMK